MENNYELAHIGINMKNVEEAKELATLFCHLFNLTPRQGEKSVFAGTYFECMNQPYLGKNGHVAMCTSDLEGAKKELEKKGVSFNLETAAYDDEGRLKNIYLAEEFGGFAIHILRK